MNLEDRPSKQLQDLAEGMQTMADDPNPPSPAIWAQHRRTLDRWASFIVAYTIPDIETPPTRYESKVVVPTPRIAVFEAADRNGATPA